MRTMHCKPLACPWLTSQPSLLHSRRCSALNVPKATVRGNNAVLNLLQMRLGAYWAMGLMPARDRELFGACCAAGLLGAAAGDRLSRCMGQGAFQAALASLMVLCCSLMFASGLGLTD